MPARRWLVRWCRDDTGLATTELVIITPVFFAMVLLPIHVALWWHAKQTIDLAAEEALDTAQVDGATEADGEAVANALLNQVGNVDNRDVDVDIDGDVVTVVITGRSRYRIVPGPWNVTARAEGRVERFIGEQERNLGP
jgi:Flp pilus assembly protein TadG